MRICHVVSHAADGLEDVLPPASVMAADGHWVEVLLVDDLAPGAPPTETREGVVLRRFAAFPDRRSVALRRAREFLHDLPEPYDVVHAHGLPTLPAVDDVPPRRLVISPRLTGVAASRLALVLRLLQPHRPFDALVRSAPMVCSCRGEAQLVRRAVSTASARVTIIPPPIDVAAIHALEPLDVDADVVLVVDRLERRARVDRAIAALAGLPSRFELVVAGTGPARRALQAFADDLGVAERVRFVICDRTRLRRWMRTASVVASLAEEETDVAPIYEALAAGAPVVASATQSHADFVRYADAGAVTFVSPRSSPLAVADALEEQADSAPVLTHPALLPSAREVADQLLAVYEAGPSAATGAPGRFARRFVGRV